MHLYNWEMSSPSFLIKLYHLPCLFPLPVSFSLFIDKFSFIVLLCRYMPLSGFHGVLSGFLVGIKQIFSDQELPLLKVKPKVICKLLLNRISVNIALHWFLHGLIYLLPLQLCAVVAIDNATIGRHKQFLYCRACKIFASIMFWDLCELDLSEILAEKAGN